MAMAGAQIAKVGSSRPDFPENARLAKGSIAGEKLVVQGAHPLRDEPVETADLGDHRSVY